MDIAAVLRAVSNLPPSEAASRYAAAGIPVFPCVPGKKRPLTTHGFKEASTDPHVVRAWWTRWPTANIGIPTGAASGIDVVDIDQHPAGSGFSAFEHARRAQLVGRWAALVRTPSGGIHTYYPATPARSQQSWQAPRVHIDFRGDGGYIIAPPSTIRTKVGQAGYSVIATGTRAASSIDAERLHAFLDPVPAASNSPQRQQRIDMSGLANWVAARQEGQRNGALFWAACRATEHGLTAEEIHAILGPAAQHAGLPAREIAATLRSAGRTTTARGQRPRAAGEQHPARSTRSDMGRPLL